MRFKRLDGPRDRRPTSPPANGRARPAATRIQGRAGGFVPWIGGSYSNVVGLPLTETLGLLAAAGVVPAP